MLGSRLSSVSYTHLDVYKRQALGSNPEAVRRAGISVKNTKWAAFILSGAVFAFAGLIAASRVQSVSISSIDDSIMMNSIAACVLGGASPVSYTHPVHAQVAGAVGAAIGQLLERTEVLIRPDPVTKQYTVCLLYTSRTLRKYSRCAS